MSLHRWMRVTVCPGLGRRSLTTVRKEGGVAHITLSNPATRNSLSLQMMTRLKDGPITSYKKRVKIR